MYDDLPPFDFQKYRRLLGRRMKAILAVSILVGLTFFLSVPKHQFTFRQTMVLGDDPAVEFMKSLDGDSWSLQREPIGRLVARLRQNPANKAIRTGILDGTISVTPNDSSNSIEFSTIGSESVAARLNELVAKAILDERASGLRAITSTTLEDLHDQKRRESLRSIQIERELASMEKGSPLAISLGTERIELRRQTDRTERAIKFTETLTENPNRGVERYEITKIPASSARVLILAIAAALASAFGFSCLVIVLASVDKKVRSRAFLEATAPNTAIVETQSGRFDPTVFALALVKMNDQIGPGTKLMLHILDPQHDEATHQWISLLRDKYNALPNRIFNQEVVVSFASTSGQTYLLDARLLKGLVLAVSLDRTSKQSFRRCAAELADTGIQLCGILVYPNPQSTRRD